jgi:hypothetical protein
MICPKCNRETPSILDFCRNCKADLREFHTRRDKLIEGTGEVEVPVMGIWRRGFTPTLYLVKAGPVASALMTVGSAAWFLIGLASDRIYLYAPVSFIIGLVGFFITLKIALKRRKLDKARKSDRALEKSISGTLTPGDHL